MSTIGAVVAGVVAIAVVAAVAVLTWHGSITGEAAIAVFSAVLSGGGIATAQHVATKTGADAAAVGAGARQSVRRE